MPHYGVTKAVAPHRRTEKERDMSDDNKDSGFEAGIKGVVEDVKGK